MKREMKIRPGLWTCYSPYHPFSISLLLFKTLNAHRPNFFIEGTIRCQEAEGLVIHDLRGYRSVCLRVCEYLYGCRSE
jgi:hypothetical protein